MTEITQEQAAYEWRTAVLDQVFGDAEATRARARDLEVDQLVLVQEVTKGGFVNAPRTMRKADAFLRTSYSYRLYVVVSVQGVTRVGLRPLDPGQPLDQLRPSVGPVTIMGDARHRAYYPLGVTIEQMRADVRNAAAFPAYHRAATDLAVERAAETADRLEKMAARKATLDAAQANAEAVNKALGWTSAVTWHYDGTYIPGAPLHVLEAALNDRERTGSASPVSVTRARTALAVIGAAL